MRLKLLMSAMTLFFVCSVAFIPHIILSRVAKVEVAPAKIQEYQNFVYCNGEIIEKNTREIYLETPVIASRVYVEVGDRVAQGQTLATIDTALTKSVLAQGSTVKNVGGMVPEADTVSVLAAQYGLSPSDIQAAMEEYSSAGNGGKTLPENQPDSFYVPTTITSPIRGIITAVNIQTDVLSQTSYPVITVSDDSAYVALVSVNESDISRIQAGDYAIISGVGFGGSSFAGEVTRIYPVARKTLSGTVSQTVVDVEIAIRTDNELIKPGFSAKASIATQERGTILTVPYEAVQQDSGNQEYVYVYWKNRVQKRPVTTGIELTDCVEILSGIEPGEFVVKDCSQVKTEQGLFLPGGRGKAA